MLAELHTLLGDLLNVAAGAQRATGRLGRLKIVESSDLIERSPDMPTETAPTKPPTPGLIVRVVKSPLVHVALPIGVVAYLRITTGQWPTIEQIGIGAALLLSRAQAAAEIVGKFFAGEKQAPPPPPDEPPAPAEEG
jgi:hypothetical protein